jgi:DNA-binding MarR family transcriptional regulator
MSYAPTPQRQVRQVVKRLRDIASELPDQEQADALLSHAIGLALIAEALTPANPPTLLTPQQDRILSFIRERVARFGEAPTRKEIADAFDFASPNAVQQHLKAIERKGYISLTGAPRGIEFNRPAP